VRELLASVAEPLGGLEPFVGAGIYIIYYRGVFEPYRVLSDLNREEFAHPIYVGKATPPGGRKGGFSETIPSPALFNRLGQHAGSVRAAANLDINDFFCRYLVIDDFWISLAESLLIESYQPLWNAVVDGFGNHDPGAGRHQGKRPSWDTLHSGRPWSERLPVGALSIEQIVQRISVHLDRLSPPD
jgi:hypothetical protein